MLPPRRTELTRPAPSSTLRCRDTEGHEISKWPASVPAGRSPSRSSRRISRRVGSPKARYAPAIDILLRNLAYVLIRKEPKAMSALASVVTSSAPAGSIGYGTDDTLGGRMQPRIDSPVMTVTGAMSALQKLSAAAKHHADIPEAPRLFV